MIFDKTKPYGTVTGKSHRKYSQDGKSFNALFEQVDTMGRVIGQAPVIKLVESKTKSTKKKVNIKEK